MVIYGIVWTTIYVHCAGVLSSFEKNIWLKKEFLTLLKVIMHSLFILGFTIIEFTCRVAIIKTAIVSEWIGVQFVWMCLSPMRLIRVSVHLNTVYIILYLAEVLQLWLVNIGVVKGGSSCNCVCGAWGVWCWDFSIVLGTFKTLTNVLFLMTVVWCILIRLAQCILQWV